MSFSPRALGPAALLAAAFLASPAAASVFEAGRANCGLRLSVAYPTANEGFDAAVRSGFGAAVQCLRYPLEWFAWGGELSYSLFRSKALSGGEFDTLGLPDDTAQASDAALYFLGRLNLLAGERSWTPYLIGGAGAHRFFLDAKAPGLRHKPASTGLAVTAGAGAETFLVANVSAAFEARYHSFRLQPSKFGAGAAEALAYGFAVNYWFGTP